MKRESDRLRLLINNLKPSVSRKVVLSALRIASSVVEGQT